MTFTPGLRCSLMPVLCVATALAVGACSSQPEQQVRYSGAAIPQQPPAPSAPRYTTAPAPTYPPGSTGSPRTTAPAPTYVAPPPTTTPPPGSGTAHASPYAPPPPPSPNYTPSPNHPTGPPPSAPYAPVPSATPGSFLWAPTLAEAQQIARQTGRLVFIEAGRDKCKNCMELKNQIIPTMSGELGQHVVGYYDDVDRDPQSRAFWALRNNLPTAVTLPLVGFFTPDLRWVHGFSGHTDGAKLRADLDRARSLSRSTGATTPTTRPGGREAAQVERPTPAMPRALPGSLPDAELADIGDELIADLGVAPATTASFAGVVAASAVGEPTHDAPVPIAGLDGSAWARTALARAASALAVRDFAAARVHLARVLDSAKDAPEGREAAKGEVAIWNLRRIERDPAAADAVRARAQRDLRDTVWAPLFV